ncbi:hypothetical protein CGMCC3_g3233 [Colletotrichum fructicola]|nr:uncharacterized protein CGMCC3_g3233 [Colletotrichum fructicola]KAE9580809.1 hypothetical protein CGMCC3_g3233 [Colletotrichum fructicola]
MQSQAVGLSAFCSGCKCLPTAHRWSATSGHSHAHKPNLAAHSS